MVPLCQHHALPHVIGAHLGCECIKHSEVHTTRALSRPCSTIHHRAQPKSQKITRLQHDCGPEGGCGGPAAVLIDRHRIWPHARACLVANATAAGLVHARNHRIVKKFTDTVLSVVRAEIVSARGFHGPSDRALTRGVACHTAARCSLTFSILAIFPERVVAHRQHTFLRLSEGGAGPLSYSRCTSLAAPRQKHLGRCVAE